MSYSFLEHMSDVKFRADGSDLNEVFISAAGALNETIRGDIKITEQEERAFEVEGKDRAAMLYNFLEEILALLDEGDFLVSRIVSISIEGDKLKCVVVGDKAGVYNFTNDVKAVTYSDMFVKENEKGWECQVVLDV